jgi:hypothetical protein
MRSPFGFSGGIALFAVAIAILALFTPVRAADKRIILIAGRPSHPPGIHEFRAGCLLFQKALRSVPGVTLEVYDMGWPSRDMDGERTDDNSVFENADAVLIYADGGKGHPGIRGDRLALLQTLASRGVGLGFAHYGVEVPAGAPGDAMHHWIGGFYENLYSVNPMWSPEFEELPDHPVTRGVQPFSIYDEWYFNMRWTPEPTARARLTPILVATPSDEVRKGPYVHPRGPYDHIVADSGRAETMMWVSERPDGGRGFGFTGGHTHAAWGDPNQRRVMLNALLWLAKAEVPAGGVVDDITEADLKANLDKKDKK